MNCCRGLCVPNMFVSKANAKENLGEYICLWLKLSRIEHMGKKRERTQAQLLCSTAMGVVQMTVRKTREQARKNAMLRDEACIEHLRNCLRLAEAELWDRWRQSAGYDGNNEPQLPVDLCTAADEGGAKQCQKMMFQQKKAIAKQQHSASSNVNDKGVTFTEAGHRDLRGSAAEEIGENGKGGKTASVITVANE